VSTASAARRHHRSPPPSPQVVKVFNSQLDIQAHIDAALAALKAL
jgi:hypothetical protein